jgi:hypothetical protein
MEQVMMIPQLIAKENIPTMLQVVGKDIESVVETFAADYTTYFDIAQDLYVERRQLWILPTEEFQVQGWMVTRLVALPLGQKRLYLDLFGGEDLDILSPHFACIDAWARSHGATEMFAYSRPGLRREMRKQGFRHMCDIMIKPLGRIN